MSPGGFASKGCATLSRDWPSWRSWHGVPVGIILLVEAAIPVGDMLLILAAKGSTKSAFGMHGVTAVLMVLAAIPLIIGAH
jgi:hypothetical protein